MIGRFCTRVSRRLLQQNVPEDAVEIYFLVAVFCVSGSSQLLASRALKAPYS